MVSKVEHPLMCLKATSIGFFPSYSLFTYFSTGLLNFSYWYKGISLKKNKVPVLGWYELSFPPVAVYLLTLFMVGFKKKIFIYFNWRIITLQNCDGFCHTSVWIGHRYTCVPSILKAPPAFLLTPSPRLSQSTSFDSGFLLGSLWCSDSLFLWSPCWGSG